MLRPRPEAALGTVAMALTETVLDERRWIARRIAELYFAAAEEGVVPPTTAILVRRNEDSAPLAAELEALGIPAEVVGIGGLLHVPEVEDVIATLRLMADPMAGSAAMRLLTGARWQLGAGDLAALWRDLGVTLKGNGVTFNDGAPLAAIRKAITEARPH